MSTNKLDYTQVIKNVYDASTRSLKTILQNTEVSIELDHTDGDSVTAHPSKLVVAITGVTEADNDTVIVPALDVSSLRDIQVYVTRNTGAAGDVQVEISPEDSGSVFFLADTISAATGVDTINPICARRLQVKVTGLGASSDVDIYIVGRS